MNRKMNEVFLMGKIISDIAFKFIINSKNISIAMFNIKTSDKQIIKIKAYNELADYCYSKLEINKTVFIQGKILDDSINIENIKILN